MQKSKVAPKIDEYFDDYDLDDVAVMIDFMKTQTNSALELTRLVLDNCKEFNFNKDDIFSIFQEATIVVATSIKNGGKEIAGKNEWRMMISGNQSVL